MSIGRLRRIVATALLIACVACALLVFIRSNAQRVATQNEEYIAELTAQRATSIDSLVAENETFIQSVAYLYGKGLAGPEADIEALRDFERNTVFDRLRFIDAKGDDYTSEGLLANLADRAYFQAGMRGQSGITFVASSRVTNERQVGFYAPVYYEDQVVGVMVGFYGEEFLQRLMEYELFGYAGEGWLCDDDGTVLGATSADPPENLLAHLEETGRCDRAELVRVREAFATGTDIAFGYRDGGKTTTAYAVPLAKEGWMLVRSFPASASAQILDNANRSGELLIGALLALFAAYTAFMMANFFFERHRMAEATRDASDISTGVRRLFAAFVMVDLEEDTYRFVGEPLAGDAIPPTGSFAQLRSAVLACIADKEERAAVAPQVTMDALRQALAEQDTISLNIHTVVAGIEWFTFNFIVLERDAQGQPTRLLLVCQDVTDLHDRELAEQRKLQDALDAAERASRAKTEFLFNMSHDIRTPMNAIIGYTELAARPDTAPGQVQDYVRKIDASSHHLLSLINDILEMSRIESGKMVLEGEDTDLTAIIDGVHELFSSQMAARGIDFTTSSEGVAHRWVSCDRGRLDRILLNLTSNALKFTNEGGHVAVTLTEVACDDETGTYELSVADDGIGMSPEFAQRLFTPFERERTSTVSGIQGTGLGLSITKSIVDLMGGTIKVQTEKDVGTTFVVRLGLALVEEPLQDVPTVTEADRPVDFTGKRLLLAEDNPVNREIASIILAQYGFELECAENGSEAVDMVVASRPGYYDAVLMDIQMPVMDGYAATRAIRALPDERLAAIPIIAMTANAFAEDVQAAADAGMNGHIAKPLEVDRMIATLSEVLSI